jgi:hypothetical protein
MICSLFCTRCSLVTLRASKTANAVSHNTTNDFGATSCRHYIAFVWGGGAENKLLEGRHTHSRKHCVEMYEEKIHVQGKHPTYTTYVLSTATKSDWKSFVYSQFAGAGVVQSVQCLATDWMTGRSRFDPRQRREDFSSGLCVQTGSGAHPASVQWVPRILSPGVKYGRGVTTTHPI